MSDEVYGGVDQCGKNIHVGFGLYDDHNHWRNNMKNKYLSLLATIVIAMSGIAGYSTTVNAANTTTSTFSFYNVNTSGNTSARKKTDSSRSYVKTVSGPALKYTIQGYGSSGWQDCSLTYKVYSGQEIWIYNSVSTNSNARLRYERVSLAYDTTYGKWSPDSNHT